MKKEFTEPKMTKCEKPLDKVTLGLGKYRECPFNDLIEVS